MKTNRFALLLAAIAATALSTTGHAKDAETPAPSTPAAPAAPVPTPAPAPADPGADWVKVHSYNFDRHREVLACLPGLESKVDEQIAELGARRAALPEATDKKDWDFAMKEMVDARVNLMSASAELTKTAAETWDQQRDKVDQAWTRTQDDYRKVKASTTNR